MKHESTYFIKFIIAEIIIIINFNEFNENQAFKKNDADFKNSEINFSF